MTSVGLCAVNFILPDSCQEHWPDHLLGVGSIPSTFCVWWTTETLTLPLRRNTHGGIKSVLHSLHGIRILKALRHPIGLAGLFSTLTDKRGEKNSTSYSLSSVIGTLVAAVLRSYFGYENTLYRDQSRSKPPCKVFPPPLPMPAVDPERLAPQGLSSLIRGRKVEAWVSTVAFPLTFFGAATLSPVHRLRRAHRVLIFSTVTLVLLVVGFATRLRPIQMIRQRLPDRFEANPDLDLSLPPQYLALKEIQRNLPQHNSSLPYPEGATGRYVKFSSQATQLGWNNILSELLLLTHLAYKSRRAYVFMDYKWAPVHYPWPESKARELPPRTPLGALMAGPTVGGSWSPGDPSPRSVHESYWDVVCPTKEVKVIWTHEVKKQHGIHFEGSGKHIFEIWNRILLKEPVRCVEVRAPPPEVENLGQVFDLWLLGTDRILDIWEEYRDSPASRLLRSSPVVQRAVDRNEHLFRTPQTEHQDPFARVFAVHVRRGDYVQQCTALANWNSTFYMWNLLPWLPDRFQPPPGGTPGNNTENNIKKYLEHCLPDMDQLVNKIATARDEYEREVFGHRMEGHFLTTLYILTNDKSQWFDEFTAHLEEEHFWKIVTSHDVVYGNAEEKDVGMAIDMELGRRSAVFMGNGWSSFTSNIIHRRLVDGRVPISNRFF